MKTENMKNDNLFDDYLNGLLDEDQKKSFDLKLKQDKQFLLEFEDHKKFILLLQESAREKNFKSKLNSIHQQEFGNNNIKSIGLKSNVKYMSIAASIAVFSVIITISILAAGGFLIKKQNTDYTELKREVSAIKNSQNAIIKGISKDQKKKNKAFAPANFAGTGFAINNKGFIITSLHLVKGSDSVFVENNITERLSTRIVFTDSKLDIAILKIDSIDLFQPKDLPYNLKINESDLGEKIFTLGYPSQDIVYGEGTISSASRLGDTCMYQISIPVNPGNSGGPLFDENGNIIGVVSGKNQNAEGTGFASKSIYINQLVNSINDQELKKELFFSKRNIIKGLKRSEQIKKITPFVFNVYVYKGH